MGIDSQVCFHRGLFSSLSNRERAPQGLWSHWMALIRMCVVPNCSQPLSRPILWIVAVCATYWTHSTAVCLLMVGFIIFVVSLHPRKFFTKQSVTDENFSHEFLFRLRTCHQTDSAVPYLHSNMPTSLLR